MPKRQALLSDRRAVQRGRSCSLQPAACSLPPGFTLIELLTVMAIIGLLAGILLPALGRSRREARVSAARLQLSTILIGLRQYREDFGAYPPASAPGATNGSEVLAHYLGLRHQWGESHFDPYLDLPENAPLRSALGGRYAYGLLRDEVDRPAHDVIVIDPGRDSLLGGTVSESQGFVPDGADTNHDGAPDHSDNLYTLPPQ